MAAPISTKTVAGAGTGLSHQSRRDMQLRALQLRREGLSYADVAKELGVSYGTAHNYIHELFWESASENVEVLRSRQQAIINQNLEKYVPLAAAGDEKASELTLKWLGHEAKLHGIIKDTGTTVNVNVAVLPDSVARVLSRVAELDDDGVIDGEVVD